MTAPQIRVVGYTRVSKENDTSVSLAAQREQIEAYARLYGYDVVEVVADDGVSGKTIERPGLQRALAMLTEGDVEGVIVAKLDRLTRSVRDLGTLLEDYFSNGYVLVSVAEHIDTKTTNGRMTLNILVTVAQWERETISERTRTALAYKRARGERTSRHAPYGKRVIPGTKLLEDDIDEQRVIAMVRRYRERGISIRAIVSRLKRRGIVGRTGKPLGIAQVHAIVKSEEEGAT